MRKFILRRVYNNRTIPFGKTIERELLEDALNYAARFQELDNEVWRNKKGNRGVCPTIELLEVVFVGTPLRAEKVKVGK